MNRRRFLKSTAVATSLAASGKLFPHSQDSASEKMMKEFIQRMDERVDGLLERQTRKHPIDRFIGGFPDAFDIHHPGSSATYIQDLTTALLCEGSRHKASDRVEECLLLALKFLLRCQHDDGTIDLLTTNFHSTPDVAFAAERIGIAASCLRRLAPDRLIDVHKGVRTFLQRGGEALSQGGIHTPNHRWVVSMALARINALWPDEKYVRRIDEWLAEGIDMDEEGQYTERSASVYSPMVNRWLITIARLLDRPTLLEPVRKNLEITHAFVRSNGEIVTAASRRQDAHKVAFVNRYYYPFRFMALKDQDGLAASMTRFIEDTFGFNKLAGNLPFFLEDPELLKPLPEPTPLREEYERELPLTGLVRIRRKEKDLSLVAKSDRFLSFQKKNAALQAIRVASAFFGKGQFESSQIKRAGDAYRLEQTLYGPYLQPLPIDQLPGDGDWNKMPKSLRPQSEVQTMTSIVQVKETDGAFQVEFDLRGTAHVPVAIELSFRSGGELEGVEALDIDEAYLLRQGSGVYRCDGETITFGPGFAQHRWTQLRGALPKLAGSSVYLTGYTPFTFTLEVS